MIEPRIPVDRDQELGLELARTFHLALSSLQLHDANNDVCVGAVRALVDAINAVVAEQGQFGIYVLKDYVYVGDARLRVNGSSFRFLNHLVEQMRRRGVGSIHGNSRVRDEQCLRFLQLWLEFPDGDEEAFEAIRDKLSSFDAAFDVGPTRELRIRQASDPTHITRREECKNAFFQAVTVTEGLMKSAHLGHKLRLRSAKRAVQHMVDMVMDEEFTLLGLTTLKSHDNYTFFHSVNVCIYALALGKRVGLTNLQMSELGTGALMHDLGKANIPLDIIRKESQLTDKEAEVMRRHPIEGTKQLLRTGGFSSLALKAMIGCFEHHMCFDGSDSGYPKLRSPYRPHVFGRLISIVDCFDALTTRRVYRDGALRRDRALAIMLSESSTKFDPILLRMFTNMIGVFPIGTTVRLKSGRLAVVVSPSSDPALVHQPVVRPFTDSSGIELSAVQYDEIDLSARSAGGHYPDEIVAALDAEAMGFETSKYFS